MGNLHGGHSDRGLSVLAHRCTRTESPLDRMSPCVLITHKFHKTNIQVYSVTVMTHVIALEAGQSSQGTSKPITSVVMGRLCGDTTVHSVILSSYSLDNGIVLLIQTSTRSEIYLKNNFS